MKEIPNKTLSIPVAADKPPLTFADMLRTALDFPPASGFDFKTMRDRAKVEDALKGVGPGDLIKLEDAVYATAQEALKAVRWSIRHPDHIALADAFGV
jgi:hypothetical protein